MDLLWNSADWNEHFLSAVGDFLPHGPTALQLAAGLTLLTENGEFEDEGGELRGRWMRGRWMRGRWLRLQDAWNACVAEAMEHDKIDLAPYLNEKAELARGFEAQQSREREEAAAALAAAAAQSEEEKERLVVMTVTATTTTTTMMTRRMATMTITTKSATTTTAATVETKPTTTMAATTTTRAARTTTRTQRSASRAPFHQGRQGQILDVSPCSSIAPRWHLRAPPLAPQSHLPYGGRRGCGCCARWV